VAYVLRRDGYVCLMPRDGHRCGAPATSADHIVPRSLGGSDEPDNLRAACLPCQLRQGGHLRGRAGTVAVKHHNAVLAIVNALDRAGLPSDAGRRSAITALAAHTAHPWRGVDIDAACQYRSTRGPLTRV
jgi:hypothetical protein